jgi:hypothetical protein
MEGKSSHSLSNLKGLSEIFSLFPILPIVGGKYTTYIAMLITTVQFQQWRGVQLYF